MNIYRLKSAVRRFWQFTVCLVMCFCVVTPAMAEPSRVAFVLGKESKLYESFINSVKQTLQKKHGSDFVIEVHGVDEISKDHGDTKLKNAKLVISVGMKAARDLASRRLNPPVVYTFVSSALFSKISPTQSHVDALFLDQPPKRQLSLIAHTLPDAKKSCMMYSKETELYVNDYKHAASQLHLTLLSAKVSKPEQVVPELNTLLNDCDAFLILPDPIVLNRSTIQNIFLASYLKKVPVIAYSAAYVKAGALLAVHSSPEELGKQLGEDLINMQTHNTWGKLGSHNPKYFSVSVNPRMAKSLGVALPTESDIEATLFRQENAAR